jgi:hypothetical protein
VAEETHGHPTVADGDVAGSAATAHPAGEPSAATGSQSSRSLGRGTRSWLARHAVFLTVLLAGVALRAVTQETYRPALLFFDSRRYLGNIVPINPGGYAPLGYTVLAKVVLLVVHDLAALAAVNHVMALVSGVLVYAVMARRGVARWLAALATVPLMLDAYQLVLEQMVMSDVLFELCVTAALVALTWHAIPRHRDAAIAGLCFAGAALTRYVGGPLVITGLLFALLTAGPLRRRLGLAAVLVCSCGLALGAYAAYNDARNGTFGISSHTAARSIYARVATFADCRRLALPAYERQLCPRRGSVRPRTGSLIEGYTFNHNSPLHHVVAPAGHTKEQLLDDFSKRVILHQPWAFVRAVAADFVRPFLAWTRSRRHGEIPIERWRFTGHYPRYGSAGSLVHRWGGGAPRADRTLARVMRGYQLSVGYTPGIVLAVSSLLALAAALGVTRRTRESGLRAVCLLWASTGLLLFLVAVLYEFSWRYFVPVIVALPPAGAFALTAFRGRRGRGDVAA